MSIIQLIKSFRITAFWRLLGVAMLLVIPTSVVALPNTSMTQVDTCHDLIGGCVLAETTQTLQETIDINPRSTLSTISEIINVQISFATRGSTSTNVPEFVQLALETLNSPSGWSQAGYSFSQTTSTGDLSLVLATPEEVAAASPGCSAEWSCRVGRDVLINETRWNEATVSWNTDGGSLRDYRHMVINHEVGHWLGFGHVNCSGLGELAPVMQQQSIDLQGCTHNPWPLPSEIQALQS
jgi:hypothetical protein